ncbi:MAG: glycosyl hydrolase family 28 protein [Kiritimatiellia bacterium]
MNIKVPFVIHPAPVAEPASPDYTVAINGQPVFVHQARVSAQPINQVWPGYQRPLEQTEIAAFAAWDMSGPVEVSVVCTRPIRNVKVRPSARGIQPAQDGQTLRFTLDRPGQLTVEVNGMHQALHLFANPLETDLPDPTDPAVRYFGPGVHAPGVIRMTSGQTVYLAAGALVHGAILAEKADNITIRGRGILDGSQMERGAVSALINTIDCSQVVIEGLTLRDPCGWTVVPVLCRHVQIRNIKLIGLWRYNADGIDFVNSRNCSLEDTFVRSYDDCIVFKGLQGWASAKCNFEPVTEIQVRRCVLWCDWGRALEIGAETMASEISNLLFEDCDIIHSLDVAMDLQNGDRAHCHNLLFKNIRVELDDDQTQPMYQTAKGQVYQAAGRHISQLIVAVIGKNMWSHDTLRGRTEQIRFQDLAVAAWTMPEIYLAGLDAEHMVQDITIENLRVNGCPLRNRDESRLTILPFVERVLVEGK